MHHRGQETSTRTLVWAEGLSVGWGCSECAWVFKFSTLPIGKTLDETTHNLQLQLADEFTCHACAEHPRVRAGIQNS